MTRIENDPVRTRHTTVLISPAMGVPARVYRRLAEALTRAGFDVVIVPRRGIEDGSEPPSRRSDWSYADEADDLAGAVTAARAETPETRVLVLGHSLGAQLAAMVASRTDRGPDGVVAIGASVPHFRHYGARGIPLAALAASVTPVAAVVGRWPRRGFGGPTPRTLMREWARMVLTGWAPFALDFRIALPALSIRLHDDEVVSGRAADAYDAAFDKAAMSALCYRASDGPAGGVATHLGWTRTPDGIVELIARWWESHAVQEPDRDSTRPRVRTAVRSAQAQVAR
ncbi:alpha/beta fold hydrolase [Gordonia sp. NPDC127522]|uniref:alpha/beta fold hydrolase n=1 Tax=Gordonia sp. NPDC127522 TaxID=3345390 RepID=UPI0036293967